MRIDLEVETRGSDATSRHSFDLPIIRVGRAEDCELALPSDPQVGRKQCVLEWHHGTLFLFPLRGAVDTTLNAQKLHRPLPLSPGDVIEVGNHIIKVFFTQPELAYPSDAPRRLSVRITEPGVSPRIVDCNQAVIRLCQGVKSDIYIGEPKHSRMLAQDPVESLIFWSTAGLPHLLLHKYSAPIEHNHVPVLSETLLQEGDSLQLGGTLLEVREVQSPAEPPPPALGMLIFDGDAPPRWQWFAKQRIEVGSRPSCELSLRDPQLPSTGFAIERRGRKHVLIPLASQPGLYLNFARVAAPTELSHGDRIAYGELLIHIDNTPQPISPPTQRERRIVLAFREAPSDDDDDSSDEPRELFLHDETTRIGTTPKSEFDWPTNDELMIDLHFLWHPSGTPLVHVGMWSAEIRLDERKLRRCSLHPIQVGSQLVAGGTTAIVTELLPRPQPAASQPSSTEPTQDASKPPTNSESSSST
ncbi:MAG: FHA domain-containing protein [Polyangia bacterium]|mgnify:FL=1|jgi:pSer/pThr/pTyr-binding forkhead associated (FHA) protein